MPIKFSKDEKLILEKMRSYCMYQERCIQEVKKKLTRLQVVPKTKSKIINHLIDDDYLNEMRFTKLLRNNSLPNLRNYWKALMLRRSYQEGILDYVTGEWEPEIQSLFGDGPNKYEELALTEINRILEEK